MNDFTMKADALYWQANTLMRDVLNLREQAGLPEHPDPPAVPSEDETKWEWLADRYDLPTIETARDIVAEAARLGLVPGRVPDKEVMAETISEWRDVLGSEGLARKIIERHWLGEATDAPHD